LCSVVFAEHRLSKLLLPLELTVAFTSASTTSYAEFAETSRASLRSFLIRLSVYRDVLIVNYLVE